MRLKVLGSVSPYVKNTRRGVGYLIDAGDGKILLDCGFGASGNMSFPEDARALSIIISHYHKDHYADLFAVLYAGLCYNRLGESVKIDVYIPNTSDERTNCDRALIENCGIPGVGVHLYDETTELELHGCRVSFFKTCHDVDNFSVCICRGGAKLVYSGDMGYKNIDAYCQFCGAADLLVCEATFLKSDGAKSEYHLYAEEAAEIARAAGVKRLLLTHIWPEHDRSLYTAEAVRIFPNVSTAKENDEYFIGE